MTIVIKHTTIVHTTVILSFFLTFFRQTSAVTMTLWKKTLDNFEAHKLDQPIYILNSDNIAP